MLAYPKIDLSLERSPSYHEGWMTKQSNVLKGWNARYFVLCDGELAWFTESVSDGSSSAKTSPEAERSKHGSLSLDGSRLVKSVPTPPGAYGWLLVSSSGAAIHLRCDSPREREGWVAKISRMRGVEVLNTVPQRRGSLLGRLLRGGHSASGLEGDLSRCSVGDCNDSNSDGLDSPQKPPQLHSVSTRRGSTEIVFASPGADEEICDKFTCPECFHGFDDQAQLVSHFQSAHGPKVDTLSHGPDEEILNAFTCPECYYKCPSQEALLEHFATHGPEGNSTTHFTPVERSIFSDVAQSSSSEIAGSGEANPENYASNSNSTHTSNPSSSVANLKASDRLDLSVSSNEALYSTYEWPVHSTSSATVESSSVTPILPPPPMPLQQQVRLPLSTEQSEALQSAVDIAAREANNWVDQIIANVHADFSSACGTDPACSSSETQAGAVQVETSAATVATTAVSAVSDYSQASARRHAVLLERVGSTALAQELSALSWGGVSWLHSADQRRAELTLEVQCLAPGAMRLSACFKEARHLLAKALTDLAANEVESLSAALEKEVRPQLPIPNLETLADLLADCKSSSLARLAKSAHYRDQQAHAIRTNDHRNKHIPTSTSNSNNTDGAGEEDVLSPTARAHLDLPVITSAEAAESQPGAPSNGDENALLFPAVELFEGPANDVLGSLWNENDDLLERAGKVQAQCVEAFVAESSAIKEASKSRPMSEAHVRAACDTAAENLERSVRDGLLKCMCRGDNGNDTEGEHHVNSGRYRYANEQALEARKLTKTDPIQVLSEWPTHCAAHLDAAAAASMTYATAAERATALEQCADTLGLEGEARATALASRLASIIET